MAGDGHEAWWPVDVGDIVQHADPPPDPRRIDPVKAAQLRDLFADSGWSGHGADLAVLRALFCARTSSSGVAVPSWQVTQDCDGLRRPVGPKRFCVSTAWISVQPYTESVDAAARLIGKVLPSVGYAITCPFDAPAEACLVRGGDHGPSHRARSASLALLAALFGALADDPEAVVQRREP